MIGNYMTTERITRSSNSKRIRLSTVCLIAFGIAAIWAIVPTLVYIFLDDWSARGQFGDVFGVVNALFSGFAFAGLILAILLQREDLELQREELSLTRLELTRSAQAQVQSELALRAQAEAATRSSRLATINFLLDHYKQEEKDSVGRSYMQNSPELARLQLTRQRTQRLTLLLEELYAEITQND
jgi:hypothetical protein